MRDIDDWPTPSTGIWATLGLPAATAPLAAEGIDWICLDAQHGRFDDATTLDTIERLRRAPVSVLVRVLAARPELIGRALDGGADGVIVPLIESPADASASVEATFYPPIGRRSWGPIHDLPLTPDEANGRAFCAVMVETAGALEQVDAIAATPHLGMIFVGPFDLSLALGLDVDAMVDDHSEAGPLQRVVRACRAAGIRSGVFAGTPERASRLRRHGFDAISISTDLAALGDGVRAAVTTSATTATPPRSSR
ncbi:aldolase/citrate lyase family protein [Herbiconiux sp. CPCC 205763]|uniref:Aldolase/citrate lyase family protein n=1 Tax=Herbiconiux aconitum TaxID=2970913 RepID=A0ABT2GSH2_9MICO|nr:aldolase/citrate lyase family protein [Herbiconiux aconitum]MCS5719170.1 aldolase/citrate lyase family protein [Herbiconiux aconitum]